MTTLLNGSVNPENQRDVYKSTHFFAKEMSQKSFFGIKFHQKGFDEIANKTHSFGSEILRKS